MKSAGRLTLFAACGVCMMVFIWLASLMSTALPLFFMWIPAVAIMYLEDRTGTSAR